MAQRKRVGLVFSYNENWIGGTYYFQNLVQALKTVPESSQPIISVIGSTNEGFEYLKKQTNYPFLEYYYQQRTLSILQKGINKVCRILKLPKVYHSKPKPPKLDLVYQYYADPSPDMEPKVFWIPDFQEKFLPQYFSQEEIDQRQVFYKEIAENEKYIAFSSNDALSHFEKFFPESSIQKNVLQFAVTHPTLDLTKMKSIQQKYKLPERYFFTPNQFWEHKNHIIVLKAINILKKKGIEVIVAFSGKEDDYRNKDYVTKLKTYIESNDMTANIIFLGFLPRTDQLSLMKSAVAIVQPSLFEGWSTVVEDAKALNSFIILSNLDVHKEQMKLNSDFFNPNREQELAILLEKYALYNPKIIETNYRENIINFGNSFISLIENITQK